MTKGRARLAIGHGVSVWVLEAPDGFGDADFHAHHAIQITACLTGSLALATADGNCIGRVLAVAADTRHRLEARGLLVLVFVEPESRSGRRLGAKLFASGDLVEVNAAAIDHLLEPLRHAFERQLGTATLLDAGAAIVNQLAGDVSAALPDPRIQRVIDYTAAHLDGMLSLERASAGVHLSPSRLRHLFVEQTGLPFKTYLVWLRLVRAVHVYAQGRSLTEAAHQAGFADSAHFSRAFRRTFGLPASTLTRI